MVDLDELKAKALAATPGEWTLRDRGVICGGPVTEYFRGKGQPQIVMCCGGEQIGHEQKTANEHFIVAARPEVVLDLLERLENSESERDALKSEVERLTPMQFRPAPCHAACESTAFNIEIRKLKAELEALGHRFNDVSIALSVANKECTILSADRDKFKYCPGVMRCAKCEFQLLKSVINMSSGSVTAGNSDPEKCPNGCGPLWRVSWEEYANQHYEAAEKYFFEAKELRARIEAAEKQEPIGWILEKSGCRAPDDCEDYLEFYESKEVNEEELKNYLTHGRAFQVYASPVPARQDEPPETLTEAQLQEYHKHVQDLSGIYSVFLGSTDPTPQSAAISKDQIRDIFLRNGFTIKDGSEDLRDYVYAAAYELLNAASNVNRIS